MDRFRLRATAGLACCMLGAAAGAVDHMTVTGDRADSTAPGVQAARAEAARVPGGSNVIARDAYSDGRASNLQDVFSLAPGIFLQPRFGAEEARLSIRGSGLQRTFHLRGVYLLQDGLPLTLADGGGDFQPVEPLALAYTEVLRGANALRHGGITLGGAINFVSPSGLDGAGARTRLEAGSFGYRRVFASLGDAWNGSLGPAEITDYFAAASAYSQEGYRDWSQQENLRLFGNLGLQWGNAARSRLFVAAVRTDSQLPGALTKSQLASDPTRANASSLAGRQKRDYELLRIAQLTVLEVGADELELSFGYSYKDLSHPIFQLLEQSSHDYSAGIRYVAERAIAGREHRVIVGLTPSWNTVSDARWVNIAGRRGARTGNSRQRSRNFALFAEDRIQLDEAWTLVAGLQWTQAQRQYEDRFLANGDQSLKVRYTRLSPKLGFLWQPAESWTIFGNVSDSFEPPSFGELSGGAGVDLLDAQRARTAELGTRGGAGGWQWDLAVYSAAVRGELLSLNAPGGQPLGTINTPRTTHRGLEAGISVELTETLLARSSLLLNEFRFDAHPTYGDRSLPGVPKQLYRAEIGWTPHPQYTATLSGEYAPERYALDMAHSWFTDPYAVWGMKLVHRTSAALSWFVEGRNIADRRYAASTGVVADANGVDVAQFLPGDGRAVYAGFEWQLK